MARLDAAQILTGQRLAEEQARTQAAMAVWPVWAVIILGFALIGLGVAADYAIQKDSETQIEGRV